MDLAVRAFAGWATLSFTAVSLILAIQRAVELGRSSLLTHLDGEKEMKLLCGRLNRLLVNGCLDGCEMKTYFFDERTRGCLGKICHDGCDDEVDSWFSDNEGWSAQGRRL